MSATAVGKWAGLAMVLLGCSSFFPPGWLPPPTSPEPLDLEPTICVPAPAPPKTDPAAPIRGAADFHNHHFAHLGFGGRVLVGKPFDPGGIEKALSVCGVEGLCVDNREAAVCKLGCAFATHPDGCRAKCDSVRCASSPPHGHFGVTDPIGMALGQGYGHVVRGYPEFQGWPNYNTYTHQQQYYTWLKRAFEGGLKLIVMLAVTNETLCQFLGGDHACDDMTNVDKQLDEAVKLEAFIDQQNACNGRKGWYRIARSSDEARAIIADGAMAVVLGIEVDTLFNCRQSGNCSEASVGAAIEKYHGKGVRHVFPIHLMDNGFGGTAAQNELFNFGNAAMNHKLLDVRDCKNEGYAFKFGEVSTKTREVLHAMASKLGVSYPGYPKLGAHCNNADLSALGSSTVKALMKAKMIIDVDHMSARSRSETLTLAESCKYQGLVSGHSGFLELNHGQKQHEGQLTKADVEKLIGRGGLMAPILHQGSREEVSAHPREGKGIPHDCGASAKSWAQAYFYAVDALERAKKADIEKAKQKRPEDPDAVKKAEAKLVGVGFGSDINGFAGMPAPRFGRYACGGDGVAQANRVGYPFTPLHGSVPSMKQHQAGYRVFDINEDGFAHMGLFPDFVQELLAIGLTEADLDPLFNSAEAYLRLWKAVETSELACEQPSDAQAATP